MVPAPMCNSGDTTFPQAPGARGSRELPSREGQAQVTGERGRLQTPRRGWPLPRQQESQQLDTWGENFLSYHPSDLSNYTAGVLKKQQCCPHTESQIEARVCTQATKTGGTY